MRNSAVVLWCLIAVSSRSSGQGLMPRQTLTGWFANPGARTVQRPSPSDGMTTSNPKTDSANPQPVMMAPFACSGSCACDSRGCTADCGAGCGGLHWTHECFPRGGCPDDYCPNPYPRQCWPPYPLFYRCVPAGDFAGCRERGTDDLTWWFIPKPRTLREAIGWRP